MFSRRHSTWPNPASWLAVLADQLPDLILLDLVMPEMDGFEFLAALHAREGGRSVPVIVVTGADLTPAEREHLAVNVAKVFDKRHLDEAEFLTELKRLLGAPATKGS